MTPVIEWFQEILRKLYLLDRPVAKRSKKDRRKSDRRWQGFESDKPTSLSDARRRKDRRKSSRRG